MGALARLWREQTGGGQRERRAVQGTHEVSVTLLFGKGVTIFGDTVYLRHLTCGLRTVWAVQCLRSLRLCFVLGLEPASPRARQEVKDCMLALLGLVTMPGEKQLPGGQTRKA